MSIKIDLGINELIELENEGYLPSRPEVILPPEARRAVKRLAVTLDQRGERLPDGAIVGQSVPKTIAWLCLRLAHALDDPASRMSGNPESDSAGEVSGVNSSYERRTNTATGTAGTVDGSISGINQRSAGGDGDGDATGNGGSVSGSPLSGAGAGKRSGGKRRTAATS